MSNGCFVTGCKSVKRQKKTIKNLSFHSFPLNEEYEIQWVQSLEQRNQQTNLATRNYSTVVCSRHFTPDCFINKHAKVRRLTKEAVPTIFQNDDLPQVGVRKLSKCMKQATQTQAARIIANKVIKAEGSRGPAPKQAAPLTISKVFKAQAPRGPAKKQAAPLTISKVFKARAPKTPAKKPSKYLMKKALEAQQEAARLINEQRQAAKWITCGMILRDVESADMKLKYLCPICQNEFFSMMIFMNHIQAHPAEDINPHQPEQITSNGLTEVTVQSGGVEHTQFIITELPSNVQEFVTTKTKKKVNGRRKNNDVYAVPSNAVDLGHHFNPMIESNQNFYNVPMETVVSPYHVNNGEMLNALSAFNGSNVEMEDDDCMITGI